MADCVLPQNIMVSILSRLPVKSLVRFKCVCKPWCNLVSKPNFVKLHSQQFALTPKTFSVKSHTLKCPILGIDPPQKLVLVDPTSLAEILLDSCNGLVCIGRPFFNLEVILWNPATGFWKRLPPSPTSVSGVVTMISLGFGCNAEGDDFKVVRIFCLMGKNMKPGVFTEVYSSKSDRWATMEVGFKFQVREPKNHVIANGNPYWIVGLDGGDRDVLLGFDSTTNQFKIVPLPITENLGEIANKPFMNWEGCVAVIACDVKDDDLLDGITMWIYDDVEKKWRIEARFGPMQVEADIYLDTSRAGKIMGGCPDGRLLVYDPKTNRVAVSKLRKRNGCSIQVFGYDESLVHLEGMTPVEVAKENHRDKFNDIDGFFVSSFHTRSGEITCYYALAF